MRLIERNALWRELRQENNERTAWAEDYGRDVTTRFLFRSFARYRSVAVRGQRAIAKVIRF